MEKRLKEIAQLQVGYSFRSRLESSPSGLLVVQMKDLHVDASAGGVDCVDDRHLQRVQVEGEVKASQLLAQGDLIFRSRGLDMTPALMLGAPEEPTLLAAPLYRIRVHSQAQLLPAYLNWYLRQREAQAYIASQVKGTAQKMLSKHSLENLPVDVPERSMQESIVELAALSRRETALLETLSAKRQTLISTQLMQMAKGDR